MTPSRTILLFGLYLLCLGALGIFAPFIVTMLLFLDPPAGPYFLITAMLVVLLGYYYIRAALTESTGFFQATVVGRLGISLAAIIFMITGDLPFNFLPVFLIDTVGAVWTMKALQSHGEAGVKLI